MKKMKLEDFVLRVTYLSENGETVVSDGDSVVSVEKGRKARRHFAYGKEGAPRLRAHGAVPRVRGG